MDADDVKIGDVVCGCDLMHHEVAAVRAAEDVLITTTGISFSITHCVTPVEADGACHRLELPDS